MKKNSYYQKIYAVAATCARYGLFFFNLALLFALGMRTIRSWFSLPFNFLETLENFPDETEFADIQSAKSQFWAAIGLETSVFVIGSFLCYELLIKNKGFKKNLLAPFFIAFMLLTGESFTFFFPAADKAREIDTCLRMDLTWNTSKHKCNFMDLEKKRVRQMKIKKLKKVKNAKLQKKP